MHMLSSPDFCLACWWFGRVVLTPWQATEVIIVGGGLAGMAAAHTVVQAGGRVLLLDKSPFCGGNSTKATSGINAAGTRSQVCRVGTASGATWARGPADWLAFNDFGFFFFFVRGFG